jgi:hypothetical protein
MGDGCSYRFDELGWLQFDRLCAVMLGLEPVAWEDREFGRAGLAPDGVVPPGGGTRLPAPTVVVVAWLRPDESSSSQLGRLVVTELERAPGPAASVVVLSNIVVPVAEVPVPVVQLGPDRLRALLDAEPVE